MLPAVQADERSAKAVLTNDVSNAHDADAGALRMFGADVLHRLVSAQEEPARRGEEAVAQRGLLRAAGWRLAQAVLADRLLDVVAGLAAARRRYAAVSVARRGPTRHGAADDERCGRAAGEERRGGAQHGTSHRVVGLRVRRGREALGVLQLLLKAAGGEARRSCPDLRARGFAACELDAPPLRRKLRLRSSDLAADLGELVASTGLGSFEGLELSGHRRVDALRVPAGQGKERQDRAQAEAAVSSSLSQRAPLPPAQAAPRHTSVARQMFTRVRLRINPPSRACMSRFDPRGP